MLTLDHLTIVAPTLRDGVQHFNDCLGIEVPFGTRHHYMGTHNHRLQLGENVYLEIVALDPDGVDPGRARWFGVDDSKQVRTDWEQDRRLRGWWLQLPLLKASLASDQGLEKLFRSLSTSPNLPFPFRLMVLCHWVGFFHL